jgi:hypothetical protein
MVMRLGDYRPGAPSALQDFGLQDFGLQDFGVKHRRWRARRIDLVFKQRPLQTAHLSNSSPFKRLALQTARLSNNSSGSNLPNACRLATRCVRGLQKTFRPEGVGNAGCPMHPQPRVRRMVRNAHEYSQRRHRKSPGIPARNGFNGLLRDLPGDQAVLPPSSRGLRFCPARLSRTRLRET